MSPESITSQGVGGECTKIASSEPGGSTRTTPIASSLPSQQLRSSLKRQIGGSHYREMKVQPIEYIMANDMDYCEGAIVKYISRHRQKGGPDDIRKIKHYCDLILQMEYGLED